MSYLEIARRVVVNDARAGLRDNALNEENEKNEENPRGPRIWTCARCDLPRSLGPDPCPNCRLHGVEEWNGRWFSPRLTTRSHGVEERVDAHQ